MIRIFHLLVMLVLREKFSPMRNSESLLNGADAKRRQQKLDDFVNIAEDVRIGAPTCDVNAHLNYVTATGIDVWNGDLEHVIDVIPDFTKPDI